MQVILVDRRWKRARTLTLTPKLAVGAMAAAMTFILFAVIGLYAVTFRVAADFKIPLVNDLVQLLLRDEIEKTNQFVRDNVSAMARKLGEMQAQMLRLDALGERVSKLSGIRPEEFNFRDLPGRGGAMPSEARSMTMQELDGAVARLAEGVDARSDYMDVIESELLAAQVRRALLPQNTPVSDGFVGSGYGMRADPFTGQMAMHAGVDFAAPIGTPIYAAAGGVVTLAETHPVYGNTVEIDHGKDLSTKYAHASKLLVKMGDIVRKGQKIAEVGSTGRSTGPHLHFEVHAKGVAQNPARFLAQQKDGSPLAPLTQEAHNEVTASTVSKAASKANARAINTKSASKEPSSATPVVNNVAPAAQVDLEPTNLDSK